MRNLSYQPLPQLPSTYSAPILVTSPPTLAAAPAIPLIVEECLARLKEVLERSVICNIRTLHPLQRPLHHQLQLQWCWSLLTHHPYLFSTAPIPALSFLSTTFTLSLFFVSYYIFIFNIFIILYIQILYSGFVLFYILFYFTFSSCI